MCENTIVLYCSECSIICEGVKAARGVSCTNSIHSLFSVITGTEFHKSKVVQNKKKEANRMKTTLMKSFLSNHPQRECGIIAHCYETTRFFNIRTAAPQWENYIMCTLASTCLIPFFPPICIEKCFSFAQGHHRVYNSSI